MHNLTFYILYCITFIALNPVFVSPGYQVWVRVSKKEYIRLVVKTAYYSESELASRGGVSSIDSSIEDCFASSRSSSQTSFAHSASPPSAKRAGSTAGGGTTAAALAGAARELDRYSSITGGLIKHQTVVGAVLVGDTGSCFVFASVYNI